MNPTRSGPRPRYREEDLWRALKVIGEEKTLGRKQIAEELSIGEGSTRTILNKLKDAGLVDSSLGGHSLTEKGKSKLEEKTGRFVSVDAGDLTVGKKDVAVLVQGARAKVHLGIEERDEAIKAGAEGATVLIFRMGSYNFRELREK